MNNFFQRFKNINNEKIWKSVLLKLIIYMVFAIMALLIEIVFFNFEPLFHKTDDIIIGMNDSSADYRYQVAQNNNKWTITLWEPVYYRKLDMSFTKKNTCLYNVTATVINKFEAEELLVINDRKTKGLTRGVTNINEKVSQIEITILNNYNGEISSIKLTNHVQLNKYRCLFIFVVLASIGFFLMEKELFRKRLEMFFLVLALLYSGTFCITHGVQENGWDDDVHFMTCYYLACGEEVPVTKTVADYIEKIPINSYNTLEEKYLFEDLVDANHDIESASKEPGISFQYRYINYLFEVIAMKIGMAMDMSFSKLYMLTKWVNMFSYILLMTLVIRIAKKGKIYFAVLGLLPINLFVAATITYNTQVLAWITLAIVLWLNEMLEPEEKFNKKNLLWFLVSFGIGASTKLVYTPLILLVGLFPKTKFKDEKQKQRIFTIFIIACAVGIALIAVPVLNRLLSGTIMPGDLRGGDTDLVRQLRSILMHPISYLAMFVRDFFNSMGEYLLGRNGYVWFGRFPKAPENFVYITTVFVFMLAFVQPKEEVEIWLNKKQKIGMFICVIGTIFLIWLSMYLAYTPVGMSTIKGVQARYYAVLLVPILMLCQNKYLLLNIKTEIYHRCFIAMTMFMNLFTIYFSVIEPWIL